jgi:hypothetical protein
MKESNLEQNANVRKYQIYVITQVIIDHLHTESVPHASTGKCSAESQ